MNERTLLSLCRDQPCYIRLPGCEGQSETVVPAHVRIIGVSGAGIKSPPIHACPACMRCHDIADGRVRTDITRDESQLAHLRGIIRWQAELWKRKVIHT